MSQGSYQHGVTAAVLASLLYTSAPVESSVPRSDRIELPVGMRNLRTIIRQLYYRAQKQGKDPKGRPTHTYFSTDKVRGYFNDKDGDCLHTATVADHGMSGFSLTDVLVLCVTEKGEDGKSRNHSIQYRFRDHGGYKAVMLHYEKGKAPREGESVGVYVADKWLKYLHDLLALESKRDIKPVPVRKKPDAPQKRVPERRREKPPKRNPVRPGDYSTPWRTSFHHHTY